MNNTPDPTPSPPFQQYLEEAIERRHFLGQAGAASIAAFFGAGTGTSLAARESKVIGFESIPASTLDEVIVPKGYQAEVLISWGDPLYDRAPEFDADGSAEDQYRQFGDNNDGMSFFPNGKNRAVLVVNNEYTNYEYLFATKYAKHGKDLLKHLTKEDVERAQAAHGVSVLELEKVRGQWVFNRQGQLNRRITANTPMEITGKAVAGHPLMKTKEDPTGTQSLGTINNCANGDTLWETYLTCEENFHNYFGAKNAGKFEQGRPVEEPAKPQPKAAEPSPEDAGADKPQPAPNAKPDKAPAPKDLAQEKLYQGYDAYGLTSSSGYSWHSLDPRFDLVENPHEPHRFGWVVEIDPFDRDSTPKKRTALGRFKHENAELILNKDGRVVVYMGDDEKGEHIYKFVSKGKYDPAKPEANRDLLEEGTLYVGRFDPGQDDTGDKISGTGRWVKLVHGEKHLTKQDGFESQAEVLIFTRRAAKAVGATPMDRPEWVAAHPNGLDLYCTLTNNSNRTEADPNAANPRADNIFGHIIKWRPKGDDHTSIEFDWELVLLAGNPKKFPPTKDPADPNFLRSGSASITEENMFNSPDGLGFDQERLWIQTDGKYSNSGEYEGMGNNQMLCCDPKANPPIVKRFLTGPVACELTGLTFSEDYRTMFVCIQHPGEDPDKNTSSFPGSDNCPIPRSSVMRITRKDGGVIGA